MEILVNLRNPAQFFASAGLATLLDLPSRFEVPSYEGQPVLRASFNLPDFDLHLLLTELKAATYIEETEIVGTIYSFDDYSHPVLMTVAGKKVELDWWLNEFWRNKSHLKNWAGTSTPVSMLRRLSTMIDPVSKNIFDDGVLASGSSRPTWGFDPRVTKNTGVAGRLAKVKIYPITELLCAVGLQQVRPIIGLNEITYYLWRDNLPPELAMAGGELEGVRTLALTARREKRSQGTFNFSAAEFVANSTVFQAPKRFAKNNGSQEAGMAPESIVSR